jgi:hypothetical protein
MSISSTFVYYRPDGVVQQVSKVSASKATAPEMPGLSVLTLAGDAEVAAGAMVVDGALVTGTVEPTPDLSAAQRSKLAALDTQLRMALYGGFTWNGKRYASDPETMVRMMFVLVLALAAINNKDAAFTFDWPAADGTIVTLDRDTALAMGTALGARYAAAQHQYALLRGAVSAATTVAQVDSVQWVAVS